MNNEVNQMIENCNICKDYKRVWKEKLFNEGAVDLTRLKPLDSISVDLGYLGINRPFLALVDEYSGYKRAWPLPNSKTGAVIEKLEEFFS